MEKEALLGKTLDELKDIVVNLGLPKFNATQIADWLYKKHAKTFDDMLNLSKQARAKLSENYVTGFEDFIKESISEDGTKKYLFKTGENKFIEVAYIPDKDRATLCVSAQNGCKMHCKFCNTGLQGFGGNLTTAQILNQIFSIKETFELTNLVFMGMGEPFDNTDTILKTIEILTAPYSRALSPRRITVSTVGVIPGMQRFLKESQAHLALSIHNPFEDQRLEYMPAQKAWPLKDVLNEIRKHDFYHQRRFSAEYTMIDGYNDSPMHARELAKILKGIPCRINLIRYHAHPGSDLQATKEKKILAFQDILKKEGYTCTIRASRGEDISAACGLLSTKEMQKNN